MALQGSGEITLADIQAEFGGSAPIQLSEYYGAAVGVPASGEIKIATHFYGKSSVFALVISSNSYNVNVATVATAAGWDGSSALEVTINSGVWVYGTSTGTPALTVSGSFPAGVTVVNNGYIVGMGGSGGSGQSTATGSTGSSGGTALSVSSAVTFTNNGTIAGGGGGGGGGGGWLTNTYGWTAYRRLGGGGGGGAQTGLTGSSGGAAGYSDGYTNDGNYPSRKTYLSPANTAGSGGTSGGAGSGGIGGAKTVTEQGDNYYQSGTYYSGAGGNGGNWGAGGNSGGGGGHPTNTPIHYYSTSTYGGGSGGSGGSAVSGNSNVTWSATGTRIGAIS